MQSLPKEALKTIIQKPSNNIFESTSMNKTFEKKVPVKTSHRKQRIRSDPRKKLIENYLKPATASKIDVLVP